MQTLRSGTFFRGVIVYAAYPFLIALGVLIYNAVTDATRLMQLAAEMQSLAGATRMAWVSLLERLSFSWYSGASELAEVHQAVINDARQAASRGLRLSWLLGGLLLAQAGLAAVVSQKRRAALAWHLNLCAIPALALGVSLPMLTVLAYSEVPVLGDVVLQYESKSVLSTLAGLIASNNGLLALLVAVFSVIVPLAKIIVLAVALGPLAAAARRTALATLSLVGKWSMADVFVVAVLVAFLVFDKDVHTRAELGPGLYFFTLYCALSLLAGQLALGQRDDAMGLEDTSANEH